MLAVLRQHRVRARAVEWVLVALVFRALIPAGFMFEAGAGVSLTVTLCHGVGQGTEVVHYGNNGRPLEHPAGTTSEGQCPFAASALLAPPPAVLATVVPGHAEVAPTRDPAARILPSERALRPGARAPPRIA